MLAITNNIDSAEANVEPCKLAIKAFLACVPYTQVNFQVQEQRDFIMQKVFEALRSSEIDIKETAMQSLVEIGRQEYQLMGGYLEEISRLSQDKVFNDESRVGCQAIEFWTTIAEVEHVRSQRQQTINNFIMTVR